MSQQTQPSMHLTEVRDLAKQFDTNEIAQCMELALQNKQNPCYTTGKLEEVMNVLAKASFVKAQTQLGRSIAEAMRELGKRVRSLQGEV